jgi:polyvinyl alcohol dehydrogenase (cytochrome)
MFAHIKLLAATAAVLALAGCSAQDSTPGTVQGPAPTSQAAAQPDDKPVFVQSGEALKSTDQFQVRKGAVFDPNSHPGLELFATNCATCHAGGVPKAPHVTWLEMMSPDAILASMNDGIMKQQSAHLSALERRQITEYLMRSSLEDYVPPKPPIQCKGAADSFDFNTPPAQVGWGHDTKRFVPAPVAGLSKVDLPRLKLKWAFAFPAAVRARSQPTIAMGAVFVGSQDGTVYAFDLNSGCARWTYRATAEVRTGIVIEPFKAGDTTARPRLFFGDLLGRVYALDAVTGKQLWMIRSDDHPNATITATPALHNGMLYVSTSSLEVTSAANPQYPCCSFRGSLSAVDPASGNVKWKSYTIPQAPQEHSKTSLGTPVLGPSGAPIWNSAAIDVKRNRLYAGTGENYSSPADGNSNAVFSFDMASGKQMWRTQTLANDAWNVACMMADNPNCPKENGPDLDYAASMLLIPTSAQTDILIAGQKTGIVYGLDPDANGKILWQTRVGRGSTQGGIHFGMAAEGTRVYVPINDMNDTRDARVYPGPALAGLHALDAESGKILWRNVKQNKCGDREFCDPGISAAITAMPGAVLAGALDGWLRAYDGSTGEVIWEVDTTQNVTTVTGAVAHGGGMSGPGPAIGHGHVVANSGYGLYFHMPGNVLLVYSFDGK